MSLGQCFRILLIFSSVGCVAFQDCEYRVAQKMRASRAWWYSCDERCSSNPWSHYSFGWKQGYADVLMGGDGTCPPVPPHHYWSHKFQSENGEIAIGNWFEGYHHGAAAALASCRGQFHPVPLSDNFRQFSGGCLPSDFAPYAVGRTAVGTREVPLRESSDSDDSDEAIEPASSDVNRAPDSQQPTGAESPASTKSSSQNDDPQQKVSWLNSKSSLALRQPLFR